MTYRTLDAAAILDTCERLSARIEERFPESGLSNVARELVELSRESRRRIDDIRKPFWPVRIGAGIVLALIIAIAIGVGVSAQMPSTRIELFSLLQIAEAAINDVIFLGIATFFLLTIEARLKRRKALRALHQLRSIAHVIDMHQLTKDPEQLLSTDMTTSSSPDRGLSRFELARYLDYCSEMLSIVSKIAALYLQYLDDALVLGAANDIQNLTSGLSSKIWQKIMIVDGVIPSTRERATETRSS
ncbi:MAG: hypothetical protein KA144_16495 [Xanthomonadaceae bacterium]|nr:hypothetical protein [Xanthomonadaceae bacterium]